MLRPHVSYSAHTLWKASPPTPISMIRCSGMYPTQPPCSRWDLTESRHFGLCRHMRVHSNRPILAQRCGFPHRGRFPALTMRLVIFPTAPDASGSLTFESPPRGGAFACYRLRHTSSGPRTTWMDFERYERGQECHCVRHALFTYVTLFPRDPRKLNLLYDGT